MRWLHPTLALSTFVLAGSVLRAQDWRADASLTWADNLSRTSYAPDRLNAALYDGSVSGEWRRQLAPDWSTGVELETGFEQVRPYPGLDSVHLGTKVNFLRKFGLGPFAPVLTLSGSAARYDLHENGRSAWKVDAGVSVSKRLTEAWRVTASGSWDEEYAKAHPFDVINRRLSLETAWEVVNGWELSAGGSRLWGQLTANANQDIFQQALEGGFGPAVASYYNSVAYTHSWSYGDDWVAYRIDCRADMWWLGLGVALGDNTSLPLRYEAVKVINRANVAYKSDFWSLSIVHRF